MYQTIKNEAQMAMQELISLSHLHKGDIIVVGCSTSEVIGGCIGKSSSPEAARAILDGISEPIHKHQLTLAAQCCEHLNRALIVEREVAHQHGYEPVCVRPRPKAGGSFATAVYESMNDPVAVEFIKASAGLDIGGTLIGMHLRHVAVPLRLSITQIGKASLQAARTRPKLIGGIRAEYPED